MTRSDWTLLAIASVGDDTIDPVELQKSLFVLGEEEEEVVGSDFHNFLPYVYGPFTATVFLDASDLVKKELVTLDAAGGIPRYRASPKGLEETRRLCEEEPRAAQYLSCVVEWAERLTFSELVSAVNLKYPDEHRDSIFGKLADG